MTETIEEKLERDGWAEVSDWGDCSKVYTRGNERIIYNPKTKKIITSCPREAGDQYKE